MKRKRVFNLSSIGLVLLLPYVLVGMVNGSERILLNYRPDMEMYLAAILSCQISSGYELQTIEAQAVIARSNLARKLEEKENITEFLRETGMGIKSQWKWWIENEIYEKAVEKVGRTLALPGSSEHNTGLAVDLGREGDNDVSDDFYKTPESRWLCANAADFGFILRYPRLKEQMTGIDFEPWHYRYVGVEAARIIAAGGLCLEEFLHFYSEKYI